MRPSDIRAALALSYSSIPAYSFFRKLNPSEDYNELRKFCEGCEKFDKKIGQYNSELTLAQLYELYGQVMNRPRSQMTPHTLELYNVHLAQFETTKDKVFRNRIQTICNLNCFPSLDNQYLNYEELSSLLARLPEAVLIPEVLNAIFFVYNYLSLAKQNYLIFLPPVLMTKENFEVLGHRLGYTADTYLGYALDKIPFPLLNQKTFNTLKDSRDLCYIISLLKPEFLSIETFAFIKMYLPILINANLESIPKHLFTRFTFNIILSKCKEAEGNHDQALSAIQDYINKFPGIHDAIKLKDSQNTHTTSVKETATATAINLMAEYHNEIDTPEKINQHLNNIQQLFVSQPASHQEDILFIKKNPFIVLKGKSLAKAEQDIFLEIFARQHSDFKKPRIEFYEPVSNITHFQMLSVSVSEGTVSEKVLKETLDFINSYLNQDNNSVPCEVCLLSASDRKSLLDKMDFYSFQLSKAKQAIDNISLSDDLINFSDPVSGITLKQMLCLNWVALHDKNYNREPNKPDFYYDVRAALVKFVIAAYDMQRGDNLSDSFKDNMNPNDIRICPIGYFNKIAEINWGIHPLADVRYITLERASAKFHITVREVARELLTFIKRKADRPELLYNFQVLVNKLHTHGIEAIWPHIKLDVMKEVKNEFGTVFREKNKKGMAVFSEKEFLKFVDAYKDVDIGKLRSEFPYQPAAIINQYKNATVLSR